MSPQFEPPWQVDEVTQRNGTTIPHCKRRQSAQLQQAHAWQKSPDSKHSTFGALAGRVTRSVSLVDSYSRNRSGASEVQAYLWQKELGEERIGSLPEVMQELGAHVQGARMARRWLQKNNGQSNMVRWKYTRSILHHVGGTAKYARGVYTAARRNAHRLIETIMMSKGARRCLRQL